MRFPDPYPTFTEEGIGHGPVIEGTYLALDQLSTFVPVNQRLALVDLGGKADLRWILWLGLDSPPSPSSTPSISVAGQLRETVRKSTVVFSGGSCRAPVQDGACIQGITICMNEMPVSLSPASRAAGSGPQPRQVAIARYEC